MVQIQSEAMNSMTQDPLSHSNLIAEALAMPLYTACDRFVQSKMGHQDGSHDVEHVRRVTRLALQIGFQEGFSGNKCEILNSDQAVSLVIAVAMLHDITDSKYCDEYVLADCF
jgi:uncharacterized protein